MRLVSIIFLTFIVSQTAFGGECAPLKTYLDLALNRSLPLSRAGEVEQRLHTLSQASDVRVRQANGEYVLARDISYEDGNVLYKIGEEVQPPHPVGDDFENMFKLGTEIPPQTVVAEAPTRPNFTVPDTFSPSALDVSEGRATTVAESLPRVAPEAPRPGAVDSLPARVPDAPPSGSAPDVLTTAPDAPTVTRVEGTTTGTFSEVTDVTIRPENVSFGEVPGLSTPRIREDALPTTVPDTPPTTALAPRTGTDIVPVSPTTTDVVPVSPTTTDVVPVSPTTTDIVPVSPTTTDVVPVSPTTTDVVPVSPTTTDVVPVSPTTGTELIPAPSVALTRVESPRLPGGVAQIEGPGQVPRLPAPDSPPRIEGPPQQPRLEAPPERPLLPAPDSRTPPRYATDVPRPTRAEFPDSITGEVVTFTSPRGTNTTTGEVLEVFDESVRLRLADGTIVNKRFRDIGADSIQTVNPRPAAFVARPTRSDFPEDIVGQVVRFTTPAGRRTSTGEVLEVFDQSVRIRLADGTIVNERFRNIAGPSIQRLDPRPAAFVARPTRADFPDTMIGRSVSFTTPGGNVATTGIVEEIFDQSVRIRLPDGSVVNKRFRDMSQASVRETPAPAVVGSTDRALVAVEDGADAGNEVLAPRANLSLTTTGTDIEPRVLTGEVLGPEIVPAGPRPAALEGRLIDGVPYTVVEEAGETGRLVTDTVRAIPSRAETMPAQGFLDSFGDTNIILSSADNTPEIGRITRVNGESVIFTNLDGVSRSIRSTDIDPRQVFQGDLNTVIRNQDNLVFSRPDGEAFLGPFGAVDEAGRAIPDDEILDLINSGSRLRRAANGMLEFVGANGRRFFLSARRLADAGISMLNRAGDFVLNFPRTLRALTALGTANRISRLAPGLSGLTPSGTPTPAPTTDEPTTPGDETAPPPADEEQTTPPGTEDEFNPNAPGSEGETEAGETEEGETEERIPIPAAPRGNPVGPNMAPMQKLNIIRTRGVL